MDKLPDELLLMIVDKVLAPRDLSRLTKVCKKFHKLFIKELNSLDGDGVGRLRHSLKVLLKKKNPQSPEAVKMSLNICEQRRRLGPDDNGKPVGLNDRLAYEYNCDRNRFPEIYVHQPLVPMGYDFIPFCETLEAEYQRSPRFVEHRIRRNSCRHPRSGERCARCARCALWVNFSRGLATEEDFRRLIERESESQ